MEHQSGAKGADLERELFILRKLIEREKAALGNASDDFYVCSLSNRTIVYKVHTAPTRGSAIVTWKWIDHQMSLMMLGLLDTRGRAQSL